MSAGCSECGPGTAGASRWKGPALFLAALLFCPCHLPLTIGALTVLGGAALIEGHVPLVYAAFGGAYLASLGLGLRFVVRRRDEERDQAERHGRHASAAPSSTSPA